MNPAEGNPGINHLARAIQGRIQQNQDAHSALILDYGTIQQDYSLRTNTYPIPIPRTDYVVCRRVSGLAPGDRVLVAWVQNDAIVVDQVR